MDIKSRLLFSISWFRGSIEFWKRKCSLLVALCLVFSSCCRNLAENIAIMENCIEKHISLCDFFFFLLEFIKIPSPGLELGPCNPCKVPASLLPLALCPVTLKHPKLQSKSIEPKSPGRDGFSSWICSGIWTWGFWGSQGSRCWARAHHLSQNPPLSLCLCFWEPPLAAQKNGLFASSAAQFVEQLWCPNSCHFLVWNSRINWFCFLWNLGSHSF